LHEKLQFLEGFLVKCSHQTLEVQDLGIVLIE